jgi:hypothetical protein
MEWFSSCNPNYLCVWTTIDIPTTFQSLRFKKKRLCWHITNLKKSGFLDSNEAESSSYSCLCGIGAIDV